MSPQKVDKLGQKGTFYKYLQIASINILSVPFTSSLVINYKHDQISTDTKYTTICMIIEGTFFYKLEWQVILIQRNNGLLFCWGWIKTIFKFNLKETLFINEIQNLIIIAV